MPTLTREHIEALPAGRELDALVAEQVLGHVWAHNKRYNIIRPVDDVKELADIGDLVMGKHPDPNAGIFLDAPNYSTNIAAAWQVVEHLAKAGWWMKLHTPFLSGDLYYASFDRHGCTDSNPFYAGEGETSAAAICRAALVTAQF